MPLNLMASSSMKNLSAFQTLKNSQISWIDKSQGNRPTQTLIFSHHRAINIQNKASNSSSPAIMMKHLFQILLERKMEER